MYSMNNKLFWTVNFTLHQFCPLKTTNFYFLVQCWDTLVSFFYILECLKFIYTEKHVNLNKLEYHLTRQLWLLLVLLKLHSTYKITRNWLQNFFLNFVLIKFSQLTMYAWNCSFKELLHMISSNIIHVQFKDSINYYL